MQRKTKRAVKKILIFSVKLLRMQLSWILGLVIILVMYQADRIPKWIGDIFPITDDLSEVVIEPWFFNDHVGLRIKGQAEKHYPCNWHDVKFFLEDGIFYTAVEARPTDTAQVREIGMMEFPEGFSVDAHVTQVENLVGRAEHLCIFGKDKWYEFHIKVITDFFEGSEIQYKTNTVEEKSDASIQE